MSPATSAPAVHGELVTSRGESAQRLLERVRAHRVLTGATVVFVSTSVWQLAGFVFNAIGAHTLGPARFGVLSATVGFLALVAPLMMAMQAMASREVTSIERRGEPGELAATVWHYGVRVACGTVVLGALLAVCANPLTRLFHLGSPWGVRLAALCVTLYLPSHFLSGVLQGKERFERFALQTILEALAKVALAVVLLGIVWPTPQGGMVALALSAAAGLAVNVALVRTYAPRLRRLVAPVRISPGYSLTALATFGLLALLLSADVLVGKHYLGGRTAGLYAGVSLAGKIVFFATSALSIVVFPVFSRHQDAGTPDTRSLGAALGAAATIVAGSIAVLTVAPHLVVDALLGPRYASVASVVPWMGVAFGAYAIAYLLATYLLARRQWGVVLALTGALVVQLGGFFAFHGSITQMVGVECTAFATAILGCATVAVHDRRRGSARPPATRPPASPRTQVLRFPGGIRIVQ